MPEDNACTLTVLWGEADISPVKCLVEHSGSYHVLQENAESCDSIDKMVQSDDKSADSACLTRSGSRPLLEMQIIRDHLMVPDTGRAKLSPPTQTLSPWRRPQANGEQGAPEWALDWPLSGPTAESLYLHSL
ncbi:Structural maintenance of chromosomes flexible hinge domain containing protein GMI1 [Dissostichus eleginoides]|uniref:Structural maintenance of chromosomes flexible hinge domain containing protein GMI1 n=1 Tax=Dissostichus eleginoides TaxID=100907 RepID=A0AAD9C0Q6_DISEL|nr:Structural maintenance of chromosomes flexible hinge domain containing protein GMI1 [Dissostichus eleginoides]